MTITLDSHFDQPINSMLIIAIEGDPTTIRAALQDILDAPGKPAQGTYIHADYTTQIITPVWNGKKY